LIDSAFVKLLLLFFVTLVIFLAIFIGWGFFTWNVGSKMLEGALPTDPVTTKIDPKMASDLAKVMTMDELEGEFVPRDPFNDRTGISGMTAASASIAAQTDVASTINAPNSPALPASNPKKSGPGADSGSSGASPEPKVVVLETKDRLEKWYDQPGFDVIGEPPPALFSINDLVPVGVVDGGAGGEEVMFFSEAANRILSFPVGTMFYDGRLTAVRAEGVIFSIGDEIVTTREKSWGRSIKARGSVALSAIDPVDRSITSKPGTEKVSISGGGN
jgi:hypothetical protein